MCIKQCYKYKIMVNKTDNLYFKSFSIFTHKNVIMQYFCCCGLTDLQFAYVELYLLKVL